MQQLTLLFDTLLLAGFVTLAQDMPAGPAGTAFVGETWSEFCLNCGLNAAGGFLGGLLCVMRRSQASKTPGWDGARRLGMAVVFPACFAGSVIEYVDMIEWTFNARLTLCALLGLTADWIVGWVLNTCEQNEGRGIIDVLKDMNLLQWFAAKLNALAGNPKSHEATTMPAQTAEQESIDDPRH